MADLPSVFNAIQSEETSFQDSVGKSLMNKMGSSVNYLLDNLVDQLGQYQWSSLNEELFKEQRGETWVLADGRDITGSDLAALIGVTNVPDCRGRFLQGSDNVSTSIGDLVEDTNPSHNHIEAYGPLNVTNITPSTPPVIRNGAKATNQEADACDTATVGSEFRGVNIAVNLFIKVNMI